MIITRKDPLTLQIRKGIITAAQNTGRSGKSTTAACLYEHHQQREIAVHAADCDGDHKSLSTAYPGEVNLVEIHNNIDGVTDAMHLLSAAPPGITIIDQRAHQKHHFLKAIWQMMGDPQYRFTFLVWPQDEPVVLSDIRASVKEFGDRVNWLVVYNPARSPTFRMFDGSPLHNRLKDLGAGFMTMRELYPATMRHLTSCAMKKGRKAFPFRDALLPENPWEVQFGHRGLVKDWLQEIFAHFDRNAHLLCLPAELEEIRKRTPEYNAPYQDDEEDLSDFNPGQ